MSFLCSQTPWLRSYERKKISQSGFCVNYAVHMAKCNNLWLDKMAPFNAVTVSFEWASESILLWRNLGLPEGPKTPGPGSWRLFLSFMA